MWEEASAEASPVAISHLNALVSHMVGLINRARGFENYKEDVNLDVTFGFRDGVSPHLPQQFLGSPITLASVTMEGMEAASEPLGQRAAKIRSTLL